MASFIPSSSQALTPGVARQNWLLIQSVVGLALCAIAALRPGRFALDVVVLWLIVSAIHLWILARSFKRAADWVTLARLFVVLGAIQLGGHGQISPWSVSIATALALTADLLDGWLARRHGSTPTGAVLDMEADQWVVFALSVYGVVVVELPSWTVLFPALRYVHVLTSGWVGIPYGDAKPRDGDNRRGRLVCGVTLATLWLATSPLMPGFANSVDSLHSFRTFTLAVALTLLAFSFASDFQFLMKRKFSR